MSPDGQVISTSNCGCVGVERGLVVILGRLGAVARGELFLLRLKPNHLERHQSDSC